LQSCETKDDLAALAQRVAAGDLGSGNEWLAAEQRWRSGVSLHEMFATRKGSLPFDSTIAATGFPTAAALSLYLSPVPVKIFDQLLKQVKSIPDKKGRGCAACWVLRTLRTYTGSVTPQLLEELLLLAADSNWRINLSVINRFSPLSESAINVLNQVGLTGHFISFKDSVTFDRIIQIAQIYKTDPSRAGLLRVLSSSLPDTPIPEPFAPERTSFQDLSPQFRSAALNLRLAAGVFQREDVEDLASLILNQGFPRREWESYLDSALDALSKTVETRNADRAIVRLIDLLKPDSVNFSKLLGVLNTTVRRRQSNFSDPAVSAKLELASVFANP
jgi:hypothetical protein